MPPARCDRDSPPQPLLVESGNLAAHVCAAKAKGMRLAAKACATGRVSRSLRASSRCANRATLTPSRSWRRARRLRMAANVCAANLASQAREDEHAPPPGRAARARCERQCSWDGLDLHAFVDDDFMGRGAIMT